MTINYTSPLGLAQPVSGTEANTWGTVVNDEITALIEEAIAGSETLDVTAGNITLTDTDGVPNQARNAVLLVTGTPGVSRQIIAPSTSKVYVVINGSNSSVVLKGTATTGVTIATLTKALCAWNGSDFVIIASDDASNLVGTLPVNKGGTGQTSLTANNVLLGNGGSAVQFVAPGTTGNLLTSNGTTWTSAPAPSGMVYPAAGMAVSTGTAWGTSKTTPTGDVVGTSDTQDLTNKTFLSATTFRAANAIKSEAAATQDAIILAGRAGGTSSRSVTITPASLTASRTVTLPDANTIVPIFAQTVTFSGPSTARTYTLPDSAQTLAALGVAQTFTAAQTFRAASAVRVEAASTQDAMILAGRAGGTGSHAVTLTPTTLSASRTVTFPDSNTNIPIISQTITFSGPSTARTYTLPDSAQTLAALGVAQTFTAAQTFRAATAVRSEAAATQDAIVLAGRAGGTGSFAVTLTPTTLASSTTLTLPNVNDTVATIGTAQTFTAAQTFRAANAIRSEAASTQDAVVLAGRAGGTSSRAVTLTPTTLSASRTLTLPDVDGTVLTTGTAVTVPQGGTGLTSTTAYALLAGGTTSTGNLQQVSGLGTSGQLLTSNGAGALPTWQNAPSGMVYPAAGVPVSTGSAWTTSLSAPTSALVGVSDTQTLTNKRINPRVVAAGVTSGNITPNSDTTDTLNAFGLSGAVTFLAPSGTPVDGQRLTIRLEDNGGSQGITWTGTSGGFRAIGVTLPVSTTASKITYVGCVYNSTASLWDVVAVVTQA